jgi:hypothetical protein
MNVIKVQRPARLRNGTRIHPAETKKLRSPNDFSWHGLAEVLLFGMMAVTSIWPLFDAMDAVLRLR